MSNRTILHLVMVNILFVTYYIILLYSIDVAFFYKINYDSFNYYVMAKNLAETGSAEVRVAEGVSPITFAKLPAYVRSPIFIVFKDLDTRIRALQIFNLILLIVVANIFWFYIKITIPSTWNRIFTFIPFIYLSFNPWLSNVVTPLAETILAIQFYIAILLVKKVKFGEISFRQTVALVIALSVLLWGIVMLKFTAAAALLVFVIIYLLQHKFSFHKGMLNHKLISIVIPFCLGIALLIAMIANYGLILYYIKQIYGWFIYDIPVYIIIIRTTANLIFSVIPAQIIPYYNGIFVNFPKTSLAFDLNQLTLENNFWLISGLSITIFVVIGLWNLRYKMTAEIGCLILLMVHGLSTMGAFRHLSVVQPFFWIFFIKGLKELVGLLKISARLIIPILVSLFIIISVAVQLKYSKQISEWSYFGRNPKKLIDYIDKVSTTYRNCRIFIESLPRNRTRFVLMHDPSVRWFALLDIKYIIKENILIKLKNGYNVYVVMECSRRQYFEINSHYQLFLNNLVVKENIIHYPVFVEENDRVKIIIYQLSL